MVTQEDAQEELRIRHPADADEAAPQLRKRRVRVRRRQQEKFPRPLRLALMFVLPVMLWAGIYFAGRALL
ncbi:hypothetical protein ACLBKU_16580 [Erythrobacter sp. NE805]|uniref:hypothetical protein n=1 Tax=Erythrobacter sp. NE805 TaxID=3389875 RepID=UPI00396AF2F7